MFLNDDDMVECPYNKTHRMLRRRLQTHLHKCRIQYPDVELRKCPFNITHLIPEPEFTHHATNCPDRKLITQYKYDAPEPKEEEVPKHAPIECDEDWDDTNVNDYNPQKYSEKAAIIRIPDGVSASERKKFIKKERKRLGDADESSEDESHKRYDSNDEEHDSNSRISRSYGSNRSQRSESPATTSYGKHRSRSPLTKSKRRKSSLSNSPDDYRRRDYKDSSSQKRSSPDYSHSYNKDADYTGGRCEASNRFSHNNQSKPYYDHNDESNSSMPEAPPPPMISYPAPSSYTSNSKYPPSASDY